MKSKSWLKCINVQLVQRWLKTLSVQNITYANYLLWIIKVFVTKIRKSYLKLEWILLVVEKLVKSQEPCKYLIYVTSQHPFKIMMYELSLSEETKAQRGKIA